MPSKTKTVLQSLTIGLLLTSTTTLANQLPDAISKANITHFALGSCFAPQLDQSILTTINKRKPQLMLMLGDNVYQEKETHDMHLPYLTAAYELLDQSVPFNTLRKNTEILPIWDDHDYGYNDAGASYKPKYKAQELFYQIWQIDKNDPRTKRDGTYYAKTYGEGSKKVQFILLDTRFFRSDIAEKDDKFIVVKDPNATMLGKTQWQWLEQQLKQPATIRFVATSVQLLTNHPNSEGWYLMPKQREKLIALLNSSKTATKTIVLSGDRHFANFYQYQELTEFTSSSMNLPITGKARQRFSSYQEPHSLGVGVYDANYGEVNINWQQKKVKLAIMSEKGTEHKSLTVDF